MFECSLFKTPEGKDENRGAKAADLSGLVSQGFPWQPISWLLDTPGGRVN